MMKNKLFSLVAMLMVSMVTFAQLTATGTVLETSTGEPIIGANIIEVGTTNGTITDFDGNFSLNVKAGATLQISYMGFETVELAAQPNMVVKLGEDTELIDEVVVVGYGVVKKNDATGSVTAIKPDDMNKGLTTNAQDMISGKIAGVNVVASDGTPGGGATITIRGGSSLNASNKPLIIIDGLAMDNDGIQGVANPLSMVNPSDIESFTVLKDASSTAIYGSRASNGVIIITTKKGASGAKPKVNYEGNVSLGTLTHMMEVMNGDEYRAYWKEQGAGLDLGTANTNWQKQVYRPAVSTDHNVSIMGGVKNKVVDMPYRASIGYTLQNGTLKTSQMQRVTGAINLNPSFLDKHLTFNLNAKGMYIYNRYADGGAVGSALVFDPTRPINDDTYKEFGGYYQTPKDGSDLNDPSWTHLSNTNTPQNPVALLNLKNDRANAGSFVGNLEANYKIHGFEDLQLHANFGADYSYGRQNTVISPYSYSNNYYGWDGYSKKTKYNLQFNCYAMYSHDWEEANQHFDAMVGYEWQHFKNSYTSEGSGFAGPENFEKRNQDARSNYSLKEGASESYLVSFFGRVNWIGWNQILATVTVRGDGSSRFARGKQWGVFPSAALGWKIKETFLKDVNAINDLKLRLGYGITGQQDLGSDYYGLVLYALNKDHAYYTLGEIGPDGKYIYYQSARPDAYNKDLTWEKTTTYNAGLDFAFLNNRVTGNVDYYYRKTTDLISLVDVPMGTNYKNQVISNIGSLMNQGVEVMLNGVAIDNRRLKWDMGLNFTYNQNKITSLTQGESADYFVTTGGVSSGTGNTIQRHQEGYAASTYFVYETMNNEYGGWDIVDQNKDGNINEKDLIAYKKPAPDFTIGFQSKWQFYNFDLSFSLRSSIGNYVYNDVMAGKMSSMKTLSREGGYTNILKAAQPVYEKVCNSTNITTDNAWQIDRFVENASFLRCDNITLGYSFTKNPAVKARIFATVSNPFVISKYSGLDPEVSGGIDNNIYPRSMTTVLGCSVQF